MNIFKNYDRIWMLLMACIMSCVAIAQDENYGIGDGFDPANPGNPGSNGWNAATGEVIIDDFTTGNLNNSITKIIGNSGSAAVTQIVVAGVINNTDFRVGNNYANSTLVDFSRTAGISSVPSSAYSGNTHLCSIMLPTSITDIGSNAFNGCSALTAMTCYTLTPPKVGANAFSGVADGMVVYVPSEAVDRYIEADIWKDFTILPIQETVHSLTVKLPNDIDISTFKNMTLELVNAKSGQSYRYIITEKTSYVFNNLIENTVYKAYVKNNQNNIFGETSEISVNDTDAEVTFASLSIPQNINLSIMAGGNEITSQSTVTWTDSLGNYLSQGASLSGYAIGKKLNYSIVLPQNIVMEYALPNTMQHVVAVGGNNIVCTLSPLQKVVITGKVLALTTKSAISGAVVSASQTFGGKYSKTTNVKTDAKGQYSIEVFRVPTSLAIAASDYVSQTIECDVIDAEGENVSVADVSLKSITGAVISLGFTYTKCPDNEGEEGVVESFYSDYNNVDYAIFNKTQNRSISQFNVQYPNIVLLEEVSDNDVLELTASSRTSAFIPVKATATIDANQRANVTFNIMGLGKLKSSFAVNGNASVVGSLYDAKGKLLNTYDYSGGSLTVSDLADGNYTLVTMGSSRLFNTIYDLSQLPQTGLTKDVDYVQNNVKVESGKLSVISIAEVPTLDESKLYYTGDNTSFTVNKSSIVAGNYLTLTSHLDFKSAYSTKVSNVNLIVDLPESCSFVENSVMVGNSTSSYTLEGNRVIIPMARYTDRVRFCIIPTLGGDYAPSALAQFDIEGETITQPIGSANYTAKDLSISVPSTVSKTTIPVSGTTLGKSMVEIFDGDVLIGQTTSLANGMWATTCEFNEPYNLSTHNIYAKVTTITGLQLVTETMSCLYDKNAIEVNSVTMINTAHTAANLDLYDYVTVFDFQNPKESYPAYWYWPSYPDFTFLVDFTNNDTTIVKDVVLYVFTDHDDIVTLYPEYDAKKDKFVATAKFDSYSLPYNVSVDYDISHRIKTDVTESFNAEVELINDITQNAIGMGEKIKLVLLNDQDSLTVFKATIPNCDVEGLFRIQILDYENAKKMLSTKQFDFEESENGYRYLLSEGNENENALTLIDTGEEIAYLFSLSGIESSNEHSYNLQNRAKSDFFKWSSNLKYLKGQFTKGDWIGAGATIWSGINDFLGLKKYCSAPSFNQYFDIMDSYLAEMGKKGDLLIDALGKKCSDGTHRLSDSDRKKYNEMIKAYNNNIGLIYDTFVSYTELYKNKLACSAAIDIFMTLGSAGMSELGSLAANGIVNSGRVLTNSKNAKYFKRWITNPTVRDYLENALGVGFGVLIGKVAEIVNPEEADFQGVENEMNEWMVNQRNFMDNLYREILSKIKKSYKKCKESEPKPNPPSPPGGGAPNVKDPSGYVYEGVSSNRLEGVTATAYYKEVVEDMYGDKHENIVKWDAAEYAQENPLFTDEYGMYAWDVPNGLWQVKFEKEGYETTYSEWLPVPPPQLDINIAMKQNVQPTVKSARAFEDAVEMEFDKYMMPEQLTTDNIRVMVDETAVEGTVELLNEEVSYEGKDEKFASKVRFNAAAPFDATEITLMVSNRVKSYAGIRMQDDFSQKFTIEPEIREIVCDSVTSIVYGKTEELTVQVLPAVASAGKTLKVKSSSAMILTTDVEEVTLDEEGKAKLIVSGELPGASAITYTIDGYDLTATTIVNVNTLDMKTCEMPTANVASGSIVHIGTPIKLSCATEGATIYYTLDGSCPCNETEARKVYDGTPIIANGDVTIKAMAVASDMYESDVAEFTYKSSGLLYADMNRDGVVNVTDVVSLINYISTNDASNIDLKWVDMNEDGTVNVTDVVYLINYISIK